MNTEIQCPNGRDGSCTVLCGLRKGHGFVSLETLERHQERQAKKPLTVIIVKPRNLGHTLMQIQEEEAIRYRKARQIGLITLPPLEAQQQSSRRES